MSSIMIASGIFSWDGSERRSKRYGTFTISDSNYDADAKAVVTVNRPAMQKLAGKQVALTVKVVEARKSGHIGDLFFHIFPSQPEPGEVVTLGVGCFNATVNSYKCDAFSLVPSDGREELWLDPRLLYRLHDQTVEVYAEVTTAPCHPTPELVSDAPGVKGAGAEGNTNYIQVQGEVPTKLPFDVHGFGGGMFTMSSQSTEVGARLRTFDDNRSIFDDVDE